MGTFKTKLRVWNPARPDEVYEPEVWVDTGAAFSWISRSQLERMGIPPLRRIPFRTMEGHVVERDIAAVFIASNGYTGADMVMMANAGDSEVMGLIALKGSVWLPILFRKSSCQRCYWY